MCGGYELPGACGGEGADDAAAGGGAAAAGAVAADGVKEASFSRVKSLNTGMRSGLESNTQGFSSNARCNSMQHERDIRTLLEWFRVMVRV